VQRFLAVQAHPKMGSVARMAPTVLAVKLAHTVSAAQEVRRAKIPLVRPVIRVLADHFQPMDQMAWMVQMA
jgi:hypothetical protein